MMKLFIQLKNGLVRLLEWTLIVLMALLVLDVLWGVLTRELGIFCQWLIRQGIEPWALLPRGQDERTEELAIFLLVWVSLLGAAVAFSAKMHLGVDYFVGKLHGDAQRLMEVIVNLIVIAFAVAIFLVGGYVLVSKTLASGQLTPAMNIKMGYVYLAVPISGAFIVLFAVESIFEILTRKAPAAQTDKPLAAAAGKEV